MTGETAALAELLPTGIHVAEMIGDITEGKLLPDEEREIASAVSRRKQEFAAGRTCARKCLSLCGLPANTPILRGERGQPLWPDGIVGSITHCRGYVGAAATITADFSAIGIDAEPNEPLPAGVLDMIALDEEQRWVQRRDLPMGVHWDRLLFSIKESVYKAWFPLTMRWLGFADARITIRPESGEFQAELLLDPSAGQHEVMPCLHGRFSATDALLVTAIAVPRRPLAAVPSVIVR